MQEKGLEDKENEAPAKKRLKVGARRKDQGAGLALKEGEVWLESNKQEGDPVGQEFTGTEERGILERMDNPETAVVEIEFGSAQIENPFETVANRDLLSKEEDAHEKENKEGEELNSEEELERSLAAEMYEVTVEDGGILRNISKCYKCNTF